MSEDEKKSSQGFGANSAIVVALIATGAYFYTQQAPLTVLRPPPLESRIEEKFRSQDVAARQWQDPFDTVAKEIKKRDRDGSKKECDEVATPKKTGASKTRPAPPLHCRSPLFDERGKFRPESGNIRLIGVTAPGAPYFEDAETRRRLRYAILSGLHLEGYVPENEQHIGYFRPKAHEEKGLPAAIPFEWLEHVPEPRDRERGRRQILLLWIDEDVLGDTHKPFESLSRLQNELCGEKEKSERCRPLQILGPYSSGVLRDLVKEMKESKSAASLEKIRFYSFAATISDQELEGAPPSERIFRISSGDNVLAQAIGAELCRRSKSSAAAISQNGGKQGSPGCLGKQHIALISDRDTLYGRAIVCAFKRELNRLRANSDEGGEQCRSTSLPGILTSTYLRGIDGLTPSANDNQSAKKVSGDKDSDEATRTQDISKSLERPFGRDQFDYLRRLAASLQKEDADLRRKGGEGVKAIGVLGVDVFDKLLVLRALKPIFPEAVFFTTDYDAALAGREEIEWTRNLIVASSYGPTLADDIQKEAPPFRSTYQTAAFLAARVAAQERESENRSELRGRINDSIGAARLFEIDRRREFLALPTSESRKSEEQTSDDIARPTIRTLLRALYEVFVSPPPKEKTEQVSGDGIHPPIPPLYTELSRDSAQFLPIFLLLMGVVVPLICWRLFPFLVATSAGMALIFLFGAAVVWRWDPFALFATERGLGEPIAWTQGVSMWPSIGLRVIAAILALCLIVDAWRELRKNQRKVQERFCLPEAESWSAEAHDSGVPSMLFSKARRCFDMVLYRLPHAKENINVGQLWKEYAVKSKIVPSFLRTIFLASIMFFMYCLLRGMFGPPNAPWRGRLDQVYEDVTWPLVLLLLFLTFLVFDATLLCLRFVDVLRKNRTSWPSDTHRIFGEKFNFQDQLLDEWIDLDFLALRTRCISRLIYFPFAIFALMIASRSTAFAEFALSWPIIITQVAGCVIIFGCAMALCFSAEKARATTKSRLMEGMVAAKAADGCEKRAAQIETLLKLVDGLRQGSFVPLSQQPPIRALLLPLGGLGWTALLDYRLLPGL